MFIRAVLGREEKYDKTSLLKKLLAAVRTCRDWWSWLSPRRAHVETGGSVGRGTFTGREERERETDKLWKGTSNKSMMYWTPRVRGSKIMVFYNRLGLTF